MAGVFKRSLIGSTALAGIILIGSIPARAATFTVSSTADDGSAGTLRAAMTAANANPGSTIIFALPANSTIAVTNGPLPAIAASMSIDGSASSNLSISGGAQGGASNLRVFFVTGGTVSIANLTIQNGLAQGGSGAAGGGGGLGAGAAIFVSAGTLSVQNLNFLNNRAIGGTGGTAVRGTTGSSGGGGGGLGGNGGGTVDGAGGGGGFSGGGGGGGGYQSTNGAAGGAGPGGSGGSGSASGNAGSAGQSGGAGGRFVSGTGGGGGGGGGLSGGQGGAAYAITSAADSGGGGGGGGGGLAAGSGGSGGSAGGLAGSAAAAGGSGGGGGGAGFSDPGAGGAGGDFGGGGGGSKLQGSTGGQGGFGGGGGAGGTGQAGGSSLFGGGGGGGVTASAGGVGGGAGAGNNGGGGGGAALGGAIFVRSGATLLLGSGSFSGSALTAGSGAGNGTAGAAAGQDLFLQTGSVTTLAPATGSQLSITNSIADDSAASLPSGSGAATPGTAAGAVVKIGDGTTAGTVFLSGTNSYAGGTILQSGVLSVAADSNLGAIGPGIGALTFNGGTLQVTGQGFTSTNRAITFNGGGFDIADASHVFTLSQVLANGSLTKLGAGTLVLSGANSYAGGTILAAGTLRLGASGSIGAGGLIFTGAALFDLAGFNQSITSLNGTQGTIRNSSSAHSSTISIGSGSFGGLIINGGRSLALNKLSDGTASGGTLLLTGANSYSGGTRITAGTLQIGNGGTTGSIIGNVTDDGTLVFDRSDHVAFAGTISGSGALTAAGSGMLTLSGSNSYSGGTHLSAGTLAVGNANALGTGPLTMDKGTHLAFSANGVTLANDILLTGIADPTIDTGANSATLAGVISGGATLTKSGSGTLSLTGINSYTGGTTIAAGTLSGSATSFGTGSIVNNAALTIDQTGEGTFANVLSGRGSFTKTGTGVLDLTAVSSLSGATNVAAGTLDVSGSLANSIVTIANGATLGGSGKIGGLVLSAGAALAGSAAAPYGTLTIAGNATLASGSIFNVAINPAGQTTSLNVAGKATLGGAFVTVTGAAGTYDPTTRYTIVTAQNGLSGSFGALTANTNLAFLAPALSYDANSVTLSLAPSASFQSVAATPNQIAAAQALSGINPTSPLYSAVLSQTAAGARQALAAVSGTIHPTVTATHVQSAQRVTTSVFDRLYMIAGSGIDARQLLDQLSPNALPTFVNCFAPVEPPKPTPLTNATVWGEGFGGFGHSGGNANANATDSSTSGFVIGADTPLHGFSLPYRVGLAGGYTANTFNGKDASGTGTAESIFGSIYGSTRYGSIDLRVGATYSANSTNLTRLVVFPGFNETERSNEGGHTLSGFSEIGYRFTSSRLLLEPVLDSAIIAVHNDAYHESGGAAALLGLGQDSTVETTTIGLRGEGAPFDGLPLVARGFLGWRHSFGEVNPGSVLAFEAGSTPFTSSGAPVDRNALASEAGIDWRATSALTIGLSYTGQWGARDSDQSAKGEIQYKF